MHWLNVIVYTHSIHILTPPPTLHKYLIDAPTMRTILNACMYSVGDVDGFAEAGLIAGDFAARLGILAASLAAAIHMAKRVSKSKSMLARVY